MKLLKFRRGKWYRWQFDYLTGTINMRTGVRTPYLYHNGMEVPEVCRIYVGPFDSYREALRG